MSTTSQPDAGRLLNRNFLLLWQGQLVSHLGNQAFAVAMMYWVMQQSDSATLMGLLMMTSMLPGVLLGPIAGAIVDRHSRKHIIVAADALRGLAVLAFGAILLTVTDAPARTMTLLFLVVLFNGVVGAAFQPAVSAAIPDLVPVDRVAAANSMSQFSAQTAVLFGQAVGGLLYRHFGAPLLFILDGLSYLFSAISEFFITLPHSRCDKPESLRARFNDYRNDAIAGVKYVWSRRGMRTLLVVAAGLNFLAMPVLVLLPFFVVGQLLQGSEWYGFLLAGMGAGSLIAYFVTGLSGLLPAAAAPAVGTAMLSVATIIGSLAFVDTPLVALLLFILLGTATGVINILALTRFQLGSTKEMRGRVMALVYTLSGAMSPLGMAMGGFLGDLFDKNVSLIYFGCSVAMLAIAILALSSPSLRQFLARDRRV